MSRTRTWIVTVATAAGAAIGAAGLAAAATNGSAGTASQNSPATSEQQQQQPGAGAPRDPAAVGHGPNETVLTGTTAAKVTAAAKAAVPGGTIVRVETDSGGAKYEAHVRKSDGSYVTVKVNADFSVLAVQDGFGTGPGGAAPNGGPGQH